MTLGSIWKDIQNASLQRINQNTLIFSSRGIAFEFIDRNRCLAALTGPRKQEYLKALKPFDGYPGNGLHLF